MKIPRSLGLAAIVVFVISFFLPAYSGMPGFDGFKVCLRTMFYGSDAEFFSGGWFYYSGFAVSNIFFAGLVAALFGMKTHRKVRLVVSVVFFLQVLSWLALHAFQNPPQISEINLGYYVWLIAYGLLVAAHLWKEKSAAEEEVHGKSFTEGTERVTQRAQRE